MKEIVEYILATLIIASIIPVYDYIMSTMYSPPELRVEETTVYSFADQVIPIIYDASLYGNLSSPLLDLTTLIKNKLPYIADKYGFHIEMISSGITSIEVDTSIKVYTIMQGNVTILMIHSNGSAYNITLYTPSIDLGNGTYVYEYIPPNIDEIVFVSAVLDTGYYRFIDYYYSGAERIYVGNYEGSLAIISPSGSLALYTLPNGYSGLPITIVSYTGNWFESLKDVVKYGNVIGIGNILIGWSFFYGPYIQYDVYYDSRTIRYYGLYNETITVNGVDYDVVNVSLVYNYTIDTVRYRYYLFSGTVTSTLVDSVSYYMLTKPINAPIYNLPIIYGRGSNGKIYVGIWYPHRLSFGDTLPTGIPVTKITILRRIGMVDYYITIYMWRRTVT